MLKARQERNLHISQQCSSIYHCYYDCRCMREAYRCKFEFKIKNRSFGYPFYYKRPHFMTHSFIHLASHTELIHKWFLPKIHEMRVLFVPHMFPATGWGSLKIRPPKRHKIVYSSFAHASIITWLKQWRNLTSLWRYIVAFIGRIQIPLKIVLRSGVILPFLFKKNAWSQVTSK